LKGVFRVFMLLIVITLPDHDISLLH